MPMRRRAIRTTLIAAAFGILAIVSTSPAKAVTSISLSGTGVLQITSTGDLHFGGLDLVFDRVVLIAQNVVAIDVVGTFPPYVADMSLVYEGVTGTTVLDFDDSVFLPFLQFAGSIDFRARNIFIHGGIEAIDAIWVGTGANPGAIRCVDGSGVTLATGSTQPAGCASPPIGVAPELLAPVGPIGVTAVPEPGAALLFATGLVLAARRIRVRDGRRI